jgi:MoxR-like ATPase
MYAVDIVRATRESSRLQIGASPRGTLALVKLARCRATLHGRDYVIPDDVKAVAVPALEHRLSLKPELWVQQLSPAAVVEEALSEVPTPPTEDLVAET